MKNFLLRCLLSLKQNSQFRRRVDKRNQVNQLQFEKCESRCLLSTTYLAGPLNHGVASWDGANGIGFMMFSEESARSRFVGNNINNAEHFVPVRFRNDGQWQYNNNRGWVKFDTRSTDVLVAQLNYSLNTAASLENVNHRVGGIQAGYDSGDIIVHAGQWKGLDRPEEFTVEGTSFTTFTSGDETILAGDLKRGVAIEDLATGPGYLMYTEQPFNERFPFTNVNQAEHFVAIRINADGSSWQYSNNRSWEAFNPVNSDLIVAELDLDNDTAQLWKGIKFPVQLADGSSIDGGFIDGDISLKGGQWNGNPDIGEFQVYGSFLQRYDKDSVSLNETHLGHGVAVADQANGSGFLLYSKEIIGERIGAIPEGASEHFIAVRHDGSIWQYNDDQTWNEFIPVESDVLVATIDFDTDRVVSLDGSATEWQGITVGFKDGDLIFAENRWNDLLDEGEFQVDGTFFQPWIRESVGQLNRGIWIHDGAMGQGYLMHSQQPVQDRFDWVNSKSSTNFIAVMNDGLDWHYSNGLDWVKFTSVPSDRIIARLSLRSNGSHTIRTLTEAERQYEGMMAGYQYGDLNFHANTWNGNSVVGRISVTGTHFLTEPGIRKSAFGEPLKEIGQGILNYANAFGDDLPKQAIYSLDGEPLLSWRVAILPYLGYQNLYQQFDKLAAWDSPQNLALLDKMPSIYANAELTLRNKTSFLALLGDQTAFRVDPEFDVRLFHLADTILVAEVDVNRAVEWTRPSDLSWQSDDPLSGLGGGHDDQFNVVVVSRSLSSFQNPNLNVYSIPKFENGPNFSTLVELGSERTNLDSIQPFLEVDTNLRAIGLATHNYHDAYKRLPAWAEHEGAPLLSWRVHLLPFLGYNDLFSQFNLNERWDSAHNIQLLDKMPRTFSAPGLQSGKTVLVGLVGLNQETVMPQDRGKVTLETVGDGAERTLMLVEADTGVDWTRPADIAFNEFDPMAHWGRSRPHATNVMTSAGEPLLIGNHLSNEEATLLVKKNDMQEVDFAKYLPYSDPLLNLRASAISAHNFHDSYRRLPAYAWFEEPFNGGQPLLSWRVSLLPYLGYNHLYERFNLDEPWDSPNNLALLPLMPREFAHPLITGVGMTNFRAVVGELAATPQISTIFPSNARKLTLEVIQDGTSNTAFFVEANADQTVEWTRPLGLTYNDVNPWEGLGEIEGAGFNIATADGGVRFVSSLTTVQQMRNLLLMNNGG